MNRWRRRGLLALAFGLLFSMIPVEAKAEEKKSYTYTLTFYAGNQGEFLGIGNMPGLSPKYTVTGDKNKITISGLSYDDRVGFNPMAMVQLPKDSKYYVKGIRQSGRDNNTVNQITSSSIDVDSDRDFVVAYGIKGDMVAYRVNYRDEAGNTLAPTETYYGNVGDKPVMAFLYIEGYTPQAYNLTRTLVKDESKNEFTFIYRRGTTGTTNTPGTTTITDEGTNTVIVPGGVTVLEGNGTGNAGAGGAGGAGTGGGNADADAEGDDDAGGGTTTIPDTDVPQGQPGELVDLDEPEVPLANLRNLIVNPEGRFVYGASILIGVSAVAALVGMGIVWKKKRRTAMDEEIDNWELK